jgi:hypothetical protein
MRYIPCWQTQPNTYMNESYIERRVILPLPSVPMRCPMLNVMVRPNVRTKMAHRTASHNWVLNGEMYMCHVVPEDSPGRRTNTAILWSRQQCQYTAVQIAAWQSPHTLSCILSSTNMPWAFQTEGISSFGVFRSGPAFWAQPICRGPFKLKFKQLFELFRSVWS